MEHETAHAPEQDGTERAEESATEPDAQPEQAEQPEQSPEEAALGDAGKRALDRMKRERNELRRELDKLRRQAMTEQERAVADAHNAGRAEALREMAGRLVDAEIRSAAIGRPLNVDALLAHVDRSQFLSEDGEVDRDAVNAWLDQLAPAQTEPRHASDLGQGTRGVVRTSPAEAFGQLITQSLK